MSYADRGKVEQETRRNCERLDILAPVAFNALEAQLEHPKSHGVAIDLSADGVFIQTHDHMNIDALVDLDVDLIQLHDHIKATGKVVRADNSGFAVQFRSRCRQLDKVKPF
jgi:hypothetical protein